MMQTKRREAAATIFSRVSAPPPPLMRWRCFVASSAPSMYRSRSPVEARSTYADAEFGQAPRRPLRARDDGAEPCRERLQKLDENIDRAAGADAERDAVLDVGQRGRCRRAFARVLVHCLLLIEWATPKRECPQRWRALHLSEPNSGPTNSANQLALAACLPSDFPPDAAPRPSDFPRDAAALPSDLSRSATCDAALFPSARLFLR